MVTFSTPEALGFDDFNNTAVSMGKMKLRVVYGNENTFLKFPFLHHDPAHLSFGYSKGWGWGADAFYMSGKLSLQGKNPGDYYEVPYISDVVPIPHQRSGIDGMVLTYPTEKAGLNDLTDKDRKRLKEFVQDYARNIAMMSKYFTT